MGLFRVRKTVIFRTRLRAKPFLVKMSYICMRIKEHFHINGFALSLALKQRLGATQKWPHCKDDHIHGVQAPFSFATCRAFGSPGLLAGGNAPLMYDCTRSWNFSTISGNFLLRSYFSYGSAVIL